jgi:hypothetical protein
MAGRQGVCGQDGAEGLSEEREVHGVIGAAAYLPT